MSGTKNDGFVDKLDGRSETLRAVRRNDLDWVQRIVSKNRNSLETKGHMGRRPLHIAVEDGNQAMVEFLINAGAKVDCARDRKDTPLFWAPNLKIAEILLAAGANPHARDSWGREPIHWAAQFGRPDVIAVLLNQGCNVNVVDDDGCTPLHWATNSTGVSFLHISEITHASYFDCVSLLIEHGANVNARTSDGLVPLHGVSFVPDLSQRLLSGELRYAVGTDLTIQAIVRLLLKSGADFLARNNDGVSPLDIADDIIRPLMQSIR